MSDDKSRWNESIYRKPVADDPKPPEPERSWYDGTLLTPEAIDDMEADGVAEQSEAPEPPTVVTPDDDYDTAVERAEQAGYERGVREAHEAVAAGFVSMTPDVLIQKARAERDAEIRQHIRGMIESANSTLQYGTAETLIDLLTWLIGGPTDV